MTILEHAVTLWKDDVKNLLKIDLEISSNIFGIFFKIDDITIKKSYEDIQDKITSSVKNNPNYHDFGKTLVKEYKSVKQRQFLIDCIGHA